MTVVAVQHRHIGRFYAALHNMSQPVEGQLKPWLIFRHVGPAAKNPIANGMHS